MGFSGIGRAIGGGAGAMGAGGAMGGAAAPGIASENQRTLMGGGMGEAQAIRSAFGPGARNGFIQRGQRMPLPSGGFGRQGGGMGAGLGGATGGAMGGAMGRVPPGMMKPPMGGPELVSDDGMGQARRDAPRMPRMTVPGGDGQGSPQMQGYLDWIKGGSQGPDPSADWAKLQGGGSGLEGELMKRQAMMGQAGQ